jgi:hypothetical protein
MKDRSRNDDFRKKYYGLQLQFAGWPPYLMPVRGLKHPASRISMGLFQAFAPRQAKKGAEKIGACLSHFCAAAG